MDRKNLFPIGEVSKLFHISVSSLRHYENIGLLTPEYISPDSGYRYYGTEQFEVLNTIRYLRALDIPLTEIEDFLKNKDIDRIEEKLQQQKQAVVKKQQELKRIEQKIDGSADMEVPIRKLDQSGTEAVVFSSEVILIDYGITNDTEKFVTESLFYHQATLKKYLKSSSLTAMLLSGRMIKAKPAGTDKKTAVAFMVLDWYNMSIQILFGKMRKEV